ncbi:homeobox protein B-H1 [Frankliniella occidentalis]|uniref:Homeobox protein B-H1 n=1 Tax=Frankliniella occidentalis TaxID=133901 RepID=A0A9C6XT57_FRAOC|nr:homeobox protein B-H1 [Frankliniella occidentalis]
MLLPYQPDYKEQLKVPGTGACSGGGGAPCAGQHASSCSQCAPHKCPSFPVCHNFDKQESGAARPRPPAPTHLHHLHWPAHCSADDADESWLRTRSSIQIHRPLAPLVRSRVNSAIYISAECQHAAAAAAAASAQRSGSTAGCAGTSSASGYAGSARTLAASLLASGLARPWARRARSAENIPLHAAVSVSGGAGGGADDDEDDAEDGAGDEEAPSLSAAARRKRHRRRGQYEMPVLSVSGPSPPGDNDAPEELEQHL